MGPNLSNMPNRAPFYVVRSQVLVGAHAAMDKASSAPYYASKKGKVYYTRRSYANFRALHAELKKSWKVDVSGVDPNVDVMANRPFLRLACDQLPKLPPNKLWILDAPSEDEEAQQQLSNLSLQ